MSYNLTHHLRVSQIFGRYKLTSCACFTFTFNATLCAICLNTINILVRY